MNTQKFFAASDIVLLGVSLKENDVIEVTRLSRWEVSISFNQTRLGYMTTKKFREILDGCILINEGAYKEWSKTL